MKGMNNYFWVRIQPYFRKDLSHGQWNLCMFRLPTSRELSLISFSLFWKRIDYSRCLRMCLVLLITLRFNTLFRIPSINAFILVYCDICDKDWKLVGSPTRSNAVTKLFTLRKNEKSKVKEREQENRENKKRKETLLISREWERESKVIVTGHTSLDFDISTQWGRERERLVVTNRRG